MMCLFCIVSYLFLGRKWKGSGIDWNDPCRQSIGGESSKKRGMIMRQKMPYDRMFPNRGPARGQCPQGPWRGNEPVCPRPGHSYYPPVRVGRPFQDNQGLLPGPGEKSGRKKPVPPIPWLLRNPPFRKNQNILCFQKSRRRPRSR